MAVCALVASLFSSISSYMTQKRSEATKRRKAPRPGLQGAKKGTKRPPREVAPVTAGTSLLLTKEAAVTRVDYASRRTRAHSLIFARPPYCSCYRFRCDCNFDVVCCDGESCDSCFGSSKNDPFLSFSWPLVAGWYVILIILFCFGRRGHLWGRRSCGRRAAVADPEPEVESCELELTPIVSTRAVETKDLASDDEEPVVCTICFEPFAIGDTVRSSHAHAHSRSHLVITHNALAAGAAQLATPGPPSLPAARNASPHRSPWCAARLAAGVMTQPHAPLGWSVGVPARVPRTLPRRVASMQALVPTLRQEHRRRVQSRPKCRLERHRGSGPDFSTHPSRPTGRKHSTILAGAPRRRRRPWCFLTSTPISGALTHTTLYTATSCTNTKPH